MKNQILFALVALLLALPSAQAAKPNFIVVFCDDLGCGDIGPFGSTKHATPVLYWFQLTRKAGKVEYIPHQIDDNSGVGTQVTAADVNGDGLLDIVVGNKKGAFVHLHSVKKVGKKQWQAAQPKRIN